MALYRFYWIGDDGHIKAAENVECSSDEEAQTVATGRRGNFAALEVWLEKRCITRIGVPEEVQEIQER